MAKSSKSKKEENIKSEVETNQPEANKTKDSKSDSKNVKDTDDKTDKKAENNQVENKDNQETELEQLKKQLEETKDKYVRLSAEFDNYRKRTLKEKTELLQNAGGDILADILPIVDDFERALKVMNESEDFASAKEGTTLIYNKLGDFMKSKNICEIEAINSDFDTDLHEAITKIPAPQTELKGKVVDVVQKGYKINDKVIRFAKVVIGE